MKLKPANRERLLYYVKLFFVSVVFIFSAWIVFDIMSFGFGGDKIKIELPDYNEFWQIFSSHVYYWIVVGLSILLAAIFFISQFISPDQSEESSETEEDSVNTSAMATFILEFGLSLTIIHVILVHIFNINGLNYKPGTVFASFIFIALWILLGFLTVFFGEAEKSRLNKKLFLMIIFAAVMLRNADVSQLVSFSKEAVISYLFNSLLETAVLNFYFFLVIGIGVGFLDEDNQESEKKKPTWALVWQIFVMGFFIAIALDLIMGLILSILILIFGFHIPKSSEFLIINAFFKLLTSTLESVLSFGSLKDFFASLLTLFGVLPLLRGYLEQNNKWEELNKQRTITIAAISGAVIFFFFILFLLGG